MNEIVKLSQVNVRKPEIIGVPSWEIPVLWAKIAPILEPVIKHPGSDNTLEDVYNLLRAGTMHCWRVNWDVVIITAITPFGGTQVKPNKLVCQIVFCAGSKMDEWLTDVVMYLDGWRKSMGCHALRISGRDGWIKVLEPYGFRKLYTTLEIS